MTTREAWAEETRDVAVYLQWPGTRVDRRVGKTWMRPSKGFDSIELALSTGQRFAEMAGARIFAGRIP